eukprot:27398_1
MNLRQQREHSKLVEIITYLVQQATKSGDLAKKINFETLLTRINNTNSLTHNENIIRRLKEWKTGSIGDVTAKTLKKSLQPQFNAKTEALKIWKWMNAWKQKGNRNRQPDATEWLLRGSRDNETNPYLMHHENNSRPHLSSTNNNNNHNYNNNNRNYNNNNHNYNNNRIYNAQPRNNNNNDNNNNNNNYTNNYNNNNNYNSHQANTNA